MIHAATARAALGRVGAEVKDLAPTFATKTAGSVDVEHVAGRLHRIFMTGEHEHGGEGRQPHSEHQLVAAVTERASARRRRAILGDRTRLGALHCVTERFALAVTARRRLGTDFEEGTRAAANARRCIHDVLGGVRQLPSRVVLFAGHKSESRRERDHERDAFPHEDQHT